MSLKNNLYNIINREIKIDEIYRLATQDKYYKQSCMERRLRELTNEGKIEPVKPKGYIEAYRPLTTLQSPSKWQKQPTESLDEKLKSILDSTELTFDDFDKIKEIQNALKSKFISTKEMIIQKYGQ